MVQTWASCTCHIAPVLHALSDYSRLHQGAAHWFTFGPRHFHRFWFAALIFKPFKEPDRVWLFGSLFINKKTHFILFCERLCQKRLWDHHMLPAAQWENRQLLVGSSS